MRNSEIRICQPLGDAAERSGLLGGLEQGRRPARRGCRRASRRHPSCRPGRGWPLFCRPRSPGVGVGLQLWAWQLAGGLPLCCPGSLPPSPTLLPHRPCCHTGGFFSVLASGLVVSSPLAPRQWRPLPFSSSFLLPSPHPGACIHPSQSLRVCRAGVNTAVPPCPLPPPPVPSAVSPLRWVAGVRAPVRCP